VAGQLAVRAPLYVAWNTVDYLGMLPANVEAAFESAIQTPDQIPGLISYLVHGLLSPDPTVGLLGKVLNNVVDPFTWLPAPIGYSSETTVGLANQIRSAITGAMSGLLSSLPTPVRPAALPPADDAQAPVTNGLPTAPNSFTPDALPSATLAVTDAVTLTPVTKVDKPSDATDLKIKVASKPEVDDVTPAKPVADVSADADGPGEGNAPKDTNNPGAADKPAHEDGGAHGNGDGKVRPGKVKPGKTIKDRLTRPSTRGRHAASSDSEPNRPAAGDDASGTAKSEGAAA